MALSRSAKRSYLEARKRRLSEDGQPTAGWVGSELDVGVWMNSFSISDELNVSPWDALLTAVRRRAARVRWIDGVVAELLTQHKKRCIEDGREEDGDIPPSEIRPWLEESRAEERLMTRAAKMAVDAGVADAQIRLLEREGQLYTDALIAGLDAAMLTDDQRIKALTAMHQMLAVSSGEPGTVGIPGNVVDVKVMDDDDDDDDHR